MTVKHVGSSTLTASPGKTANRAVDDGRVLLLAGGAIGRKPLIPMGTATPAWMSTSALLVCTGLVGDIVPREVIGFTSVVCSHLGVTDPKGPLIPVDITQSVGGGGNLFLPNAYGSPPAHSACQLHAV